jgi:hypothetical protein
VTNGTFRAQVDFGAAAFNGSDRYLNIAVRCPAGSGSYITLAPRQAITPAPYAQFSENAPWSGIAGIPDGLVSLGGLACTNGQIPKWNGTAWACAADVDTLYTAGTGLSLTSGQFSLTTPYQLPQACSGGQVPAWNGTSWTCSTPTTDWSQTGNVGTTAGTNFIGTTDDQALEFRVNNVRALRIEPDASSPNIIGGYSGNLVNGGFGAFIGGGGTLGAVNQAGGNFPTIGGGQNNLASGAFPTVAGGLGNKANALGATVGGGESNTAGTNGWATVAGGQGNTASGSSSTVAGGGSNTASGATSAIGGGFSNTASGDRATVPGGDNNTASGNYSFAAGRRGKAANDGAFVWADSSDFDFTSAADNQFSVRATGGVQFVTALDGAGAATAGVELAAGSGSWSSLSDVNAKSSFTPVDPQTILAKVAALPLSTWSYNAQNPGVRHIGPMAQDFYAAFSVGEDDRHISTVDADGVALAAIQGLYQVVQTRQTEIDQLKAENAELQNQVNDLQAKQKDFDARLTKLEAQAASGSPNAGGGLGLVLFVVSGGALAWWHRPERQA